MFKTLNTICLSEFSTLPKLWLFGVLSTKPAVLLDFQISCGKPSFIMKRVYVLSGKVPPPQIQEIIHHPRHSLKIMNYLRSSKNHFPIPSTV